MDQINLIDKYKHWFHETAIATLNVDDYSLQSLANTTLPKELTLCAVFISRSARIQPGW